MSSRFQLIVVSMALACAHPSGSHAMDTEAYRDVVTPRNVAGRFNGTRLDQVVGRPNGGSGLARDAHGEVFFYNNAGGPARGGHVPMISIFDAGYPLDRLNFTERLDYTRLDALPHAVPWRPSRFIGASLAVGDFDGNGRSDLVVGVPGARVRRHTAAGAVVVYWGGDVGSLSTTFDFPDGNEAVVLSQATLLGSVAERDDFFGHALAVGDFDCDGVDDLAIGVPFEDYTREDAGMVHVVYGLAPGAPRATFGDDNQYFTNASIPGESRTRNAQFGYSLASGHFNLPSRGTCDSLAVGAPGKDSSAGAVYMVYRGEGRAAGEPIAFDLTQRIDQAPDGVTSTRRAGDRFGEAVGATTFRTLIDDLWVMSSGEDTDNCPEPGRHFYNVFQGPTIDPANDQGHYCGFFPPDLLEKRGYTQEYETHVGGIAIYVPESMDYTFSARSGVATTNAALLVHGTVAGPADPNPCAGGGTHMLARPVWREAAEDERFVLVAPNIESRYFNWNAACVRPPGSFPLDETGWGGLALSGSDGTGFYGFDRYVNTFMEDLSRVNVESRTFRLYGHSRGGWFVSRYLWAHPDRLDRVVIGSAGSYLSDALNCNDEWPQCTEHRYSLQVWPDWSEHVVIDPLGEQWGFPPGAGRSEARARWERIVDGRQIDIVLGHRATGSGAESCESQCRAPIWMAQVNAYRTSSTSPRVEACWVIGAGHGGGTMPTAADRLIREAAWDTTVCNTSPNSSCNCTPYSLWPPDDP